MNTFHPGTQGLHNTTLPGLHPGLYQAGSCGSFSKSVTSILVGMAIDQGLINSIDETVGDITGGLESRVAQDTISQMALEASLFSSFRKWNFCLLPRVNLIIPIASRDNSGWIPSPWLWTIFLTLCSSFRNFLCAFLYFVFQIRIIFSNLTRTLYPRHERDCISKKAGCALYPGQHLWSPGILLLPKEHPFPGQDWTNEV